MKSISCVFTLWDYFNDTFLQAQLLSFSFSIFFLSLCLCLSRACRSTSARPPKTTWSMTPTSLKRGARSLSRWVVQSQFWTPSIWKQTKSSCRKYQSSIKCCQRTVFPLPPLQGKGYMKTYWLKGKKDLSFKTPAELRYSGEQKDSEDISSNGWVGKILDRKSLCFSSSTSHPPCSTGQTDLESCLQCCCMFGHLHADLGSHFKANWQATEEKLPAGDAA